MNKRTSISLLFIISILISSCQKEKKLVLWYDEPAVSWGDALPIGNGFMGAMIFGGVDQEHLQLNESTLYSGDPSSVYKDVDITKTYDQVVKMLKNEEFVEATDFVKKHWLGRLPQSYLPLGDLFLHFEDSGEVTNYRRELDLDEAKVTISYSKNGVNYKREIFASNPARLIVMRLTTDKPGMLNFTADYTSEHPTAGQYTDDQNVLVLKGQAPGIVERRTLDEIENRNEQYKHPEFFNEDGSRKFDKTVLYGSEIDGRGMYFESRLKAVSNGLVYTNEKGLNIRNASEALLLLSAATSFNGYDKDPVKEGVNPGEIVCEHLQEASDQSYKQLFNSHLKDYRNLFSRVSLSFEEKGFDVGKPADERIIHFNDSKDDGLIATMFQFGRYLLISSSREGGQPANLQGIWNKDVIPAWNCGYTMNINTEMNYWPAEVTNLEECISPLIGMIDELAENGKETAKHMYNRRGWVAHHNTSIWREAYPVDKNPKWASWPMSSGWLCSHLWEHYLFTGDNDFLRDEAYPVMKGAAEFYVDWLIENEEGYLVTPVSVSPENMFYTHDGEEASVSMGTTMDLSIIRGIFDQTIKAAKLLHVDKDLQTGLQQKLNNLLPFQVGAKGQLLEWPVEFKETEPEHRHVSHLYGCFPGNQITPDLTPDLARAVERTLDLRGDKSTGWSMVWKISLWARLLNGDRANDLIQTIFNPGGFGGDRSITGGLYKSLLGNYPIFQIDENFGFTAGVAEMLLQSHNGYIYLLPALPSQWVKGEVKGLLARGGFEVDMKWEDGKLVKAKVKSKLGGNCRIRSSVPLSVKGSKWVMAKDSNPNPYFALFNGMENQQQSFDDLVIDFETEAGKEYVLYAED